MGQMIIQSPEGGRQAPPARLWAGHPQPPVGGATGPPAPARPRLGTYLQIGRKKLQTGHVAPWVGDRGIFLKFFETDIYF